MRHKSKLYCKDGDISWGICLFGKMGNKCITVFSAAAAIRSQIWTNICNWQRILQSATAPASMIIICFEGGAGIAIPDCDRVWRLKGRGEAADLIFIPAFRFCCNCIELHSNYSDQDYAGYKKAEYAFSFAPPRPCPCIPPPTAYFHMPTPVSPWLWSIALFPAFCVNSIVSIGLAYPLPPLCFGQKNVFWSHCLSRALLFCFPT